MKPIRTTIFALSALIGATACVQTPAPQTAITGVWANADCELLRTDHFALLFERRDSLLTATLHRMDAGDTILLGKVVFDKDSLVKQQVWTKDQIRQHADLGTLQSDSRLRIAVNAGEQLLEKIEALTITEPYLMPEASPLEIGSCIQQWTLGTAYDCRDAQLAFEGGTNRHSYTFNVRPDFVYCRAARMRYNDHGGLFAQNIRMMSSPWEQTAYMAPDNLTQSAAPLVIDDSKFSPDQCVFDREGIYWSFIRFEGDTAVLNGCGEIYRFARPDEGELTEWIAFEKY